MILGILNRHDFDPRDNGTFYFIGLVAWSLNTYYVMHSDEKVCRHFGWIITGLFAAFILFELVVYCILQFEGFPIFPD